MSTDLAGLRARILAVKAQAVADLALLDWLERTAPGNYGHALRNLTARYPEGDNK